MANILTPYRDWEAAFEKINEVRNCPIPPGHPKIDVDQAFCVCDEGAPLKGHFSCKLDTVIRRNQYDNHPPLREQYEAVRKKIAKEEQKSFHLLFPHFLVLFIFGLHLNPLTWIVRKGKGRMCVDCSTPLDSADDGTPNASIPGTKDGEINETPPVYFGSALPRHLTHIWNTRIAHPLEDILQFSNDIESAFHRLLYHPVLGIIFASVFMEFLIIPIGLVFRARNSPSWWCLLSEVRAHLAAHYQDWAPLSDLAASVALPPPSYSKRTI